MRDIYTSFTFKESEKGKVLIKGHIARMSAKDMLFNFIEIVLDDLIIDDKTEKLNTRKNPVESRRLK